MATRSIDMFRALRTRTSLKGLGPLEPYFNSLEPWSTPIKMVRTSGPSSTDKAGVVRRRATSCVGKSVTMSTLPESKAAMRVGSDLIGV